MFFTKHSNQNTKFIIRFFVHNPRRASRIASLQTAPPEVHVMVPKVHVIERIPSPRVIKSHLPFSLLHSQLLDTSKVNIMSIIHYTLENYVINMTS